MDTLFETLASTVTHPITIVGLLITSGVWFVLGRQVRRLGAIIRELREMPVQERRYTLERTYKLHPGVGNPPIGFVRQRRKRVLTYLVAWTILFTVIFSVVTIRAAFRAETIQWTLEDSQLVPEEFGYNWQIDLVNQSRERVVIEQVDLNVLAKRPHPETDRKRPEYGQRTTNGRKHAALKPYSDQASIVRPVEQYSIPPREKVTLSVFLDGYHSAHEGWIYDVQLAVQWRVAEESTVLTKLGSVYRIGWPGMPGALEADSSAGPSAEPVTDPVVKVEE